MTDSNNMKCAICSYGPPDWQYKCLNCENTFEMRAPKGPSDERNRRCPVCDSGDIEQVNVVKSEVCPPGG